MTVNERYRSAKIMEAVIEKLPELVKKEISIQLKEVVKGDVEKYKEVRTQKEAIQTWGFEYGDMIKDWMIDVYQYRMAIIETIHEAFREKQKEIQGD